MPVTRACRASAVVLAWIQVSRSTIEYDMSMSTDTAARPRRSVSATSKSSTESAMRPPSGGAAAAHRVGQRADDVDRLLVAELPGPGGTGQLAGRTRRVDLVIALPAGRQRGEHLAQRGLPDPAHGLRGQFQPAAGSVQPALLLQLALDPAQLGEVVQSAAAQRAAHRVLVDVVQGRAGVLLAEGGHQFLGVGEVLERGRGVAHAERLLPGQAGAAVPIQVRTARAQGVGEPVHLGRHPEVGEDALGGLREFRALVRGEGGHHPLRRGHPAGEGVDQLVEVLRVVGEEVAVALHEVVELILRQFTALVGGEHLVQLGQHVAHAGHVLGGGALQGILHPGEAAVEDLAAQQVLGLLEGLAAASGERQS